MIHLVLIRLTVFHVHVTETRLQRLDADRKNQE
jgi:hypothetical protein